MLILGKLLKTKSYKTIYHIFKSSLGSICPRNPSICLQLQYNYFYMKKDTLLILSKLH